MLKYAVQWSCILMCFILRLDAQNESSNIASFGKVWGFLKYHHPNITKNNMNWDSIFIYNLPNIKKVKTKDELDVYLDNFISALGKVDTCKTCVKHNLDTLFAKNHDLSWFSSFSHVVEKKLQWIRENRQRGNQKYVKYNYSFANFDSEDYYRMQAPLPNENYRLLCLMRLWNIVEYFFPYKYQMDENWNKVLMDFIPQFQNAREVTAYHFTIASLLTKLNDGHADHFSYNPTLMTYAGAFLLPLEFKIIGNKVYLTNCNNSTSLEKLGLRLGDEIIAIDHERVKDKIAFYRSYIGASNKSTQDFYLTYNMLKRTTKPNVNIVVKRNGLKKTIKNIPTSYTPAMDYFKMKRTKNTGLIENDIAYLDLSHTTTAQIDSVMNYFINQNTKGLIVDLRHGNNISFDTLATYFTKKPVLATCYATSYTPSVFKYNYQYTGYTKIPTKKNFDKKVYVLVGAGTQSFLENTTMHFQAFAKATVIGEQTAGADGNIFYVPLVSGFRCAMTGIGWFYPDKSITQRVGVRIDKKVSPTLQNIKKGKDSVLEAAIQEIMKGD